MRTNYYLKGFGMENNMEELKQNHKDWRDISVAQISNANNILITLATGLLAFCFNESKVSNIYIDTRQEINIVKLFFVISIVLIALSLIYGVAVLFTRLYDFRISRHIALSIQRFGKFSRDDDVCEVSSLERIMVLFKIIFLKIDFITFDEAKKLDEDHSKKKLHNLRRLVKVLGNSSWRWTKMQASFFLLSGLCYLIFKITSRG